MRKLRWKDGDRKEKKKREDIQVIEEETKSEGL